MTSGEAAPTSDGYVMHLPYAADAAGLARDFVAAHAQALPPELADDAQLLVSELVTNAIRYGRPDVTLRLRLDPPWIGIAISDMGDEEDAIVPAQARPTDTSGRGLMILDALSSRWGVVRSDPPPGKTVWFELQRPATAATGQS